MVFPQSASRDATCSRSIARIVQSLRTRCLTAKEGELRGRAKTKCKGVCEVFTTLRTRCLTAKEGERCHLLQSKIIFTALRNHRTRSFVVSGWVDADVTSCSNIGFAMEHFNDLYNSKESQSPYLNHSARPSLSFPCPHLRNLSLVFPSVGVFRIEKQHFSFRLLASILGHAARCCCALDFEECF